jgi:serine/threonine-protein kinase
MTRACPRCGRGFPERLSACPGCILEADAPRALLGEQLELIEPIGEGGMGTVWRGRDLRLGREVAVKILKPALAADPELAARFDREARALGALNHPGIVMVHGAGQEGAERYLVLEHVSGRPLSTRIPVDAAEARRISLALCDALAYAHERGLVHRDVKPANVLIDAAGTVKLTDFGIARALAGGDGGALTREGHVVGTPEYMAPEALRGAAPDARMDVYSLGVVLHEMLTGRRVPSALETLPAGLGSIVERATAKDPARRYPTMAALRKDLERSPVDDPAALPPEERLWMEAVALLLTLASAVAFWAVLASVTPRILAPGGSEPLVMLGRETLADGRLVSRARFETGSVLAAVAAFAVALAGVGVLRRHWRVAGLERSDGPGSLRGANVVLALGAFSLAFYGAYRLLDGTGRAWASAYVPIAGGLIETAAVFFFWIAVLDGTRRHIPVATSGRLWLGTLLTLVPPVLEFSRFVRDWRP